MGVGPNSTAMYSIRRETELQYERIFRAVWKKLEALLRSPQEKASPGRTLQRPKREGKEKDGTIPALKMDTLKKGPTTPKWRKAATRLRPHEAHKAKGTPTAQHHRQPRRKAATQSGFKRGKARQDRPRGWRTVKPKLAETTTLPHRTGNSQRPHQSVQFTARTPRYSPSEHLTRTASTLHIRNAEQESQAQGAGQYSAHTRNRLNSIAGERLTLGYL
ncbi:Hypothetical predicted protein [Pelobates cultripes]|uniref:Uncharacterized protein n=1 Tax=Pelobates cultripes TaxID=61616 RepID=A0AAD1SL30_PELCU|nr:Hypothetical predicted protein [Pelobates cultripes]